MPWFTPPGPRQVPRADLLGADAGEQTRAFPEGKLWTKAALTQRLAGGLGEAESGDPLSQAVAE